MIIPPSELLDGVRAGVYLQGLGQRDLKNPEGAGFDLRLGQLHALGSPAQLGVEKRSTPDPVDCPITDNFFTLEPGQYYLATTQERAELPVGMAALLIPRST